MVFDIESNAINKRKASQLGGKALTKSTSTGLYSDPELAQFYEVNDHDRMDYDVISKLAGGAKRVLDLGCGTGVLSARLAENADVVAVDPASAMLDIARRRYHGLNIEWIEGDARNIRLGHKFDFIVLSGHAFQVFLTKEDQLEVLRTITVHLSNRGRFIFDSRNPYFPPSKERTKAETIHKFEHSSLGEVEAWNESSYDDYSGVLTYSNSYRLPDAPEAKSAVEKIKYTSKSELMELVAEVGLKVIECFGNWNETPYLETSKEIILIGGLE